MAVQVNSRTSRGYGRQHEAERARWQRQLDAGLIVQCCCARPECTKHAGQCPKAIDANTQWDLGHTIDRTAWTGPECVPCNRSDGGRRGRAKQLQPVAVYRDW